MKMRKTILLIEDEEELLSILTTILAKAGYEVLPRSGWKDTVLDPASLPDLILLDKYLRGENGLHICKKIKSSEKTRHIPVIILSASPGSNEEVSAAQADEFVEKPFDINLLLNMIGGYLA